MAAHTYWRLNVSANAGNASALNIVEVEMRATVGGADQCTGGTASASTFEASSPPGNAFDNSGSIWSAASGIVTGWIAYQFPSPVEVAQYTIQGRATFLSQNPKDWTLEWSDDGSAWTAVESRQDISFTANEIKTFTVPTTPSNARITQAVVEVVRAGTPAARISQAVVEVVRTSTATARVGQLAVEALRTNSAPTAYLGQVAVEALHTNSAPTACLGQLAIEVLRPNAPELPPSSGTTKGNFFLLF